MGTRLYCVLLACIQPIPRLERKRSNERNELCSKPCFRDVARSIVIDSPSSSFFFLVTPPSSVARSFDEENSEKRVAKKSEKKKKENLANFDERINE